MKKMIVLLAAVAVAGAASADLAVKFSSSVIFLNPGETTPINSTKVLPTGSYAQLLWNPSNAGYRDGNIGASLLDAGDILLAEAYSTTTGARFNDDISVYDSATVGVVDVNSGYFFARIFETATPAAGDYFIEVGLQGPSLTQYDSLNVNTIYYGSGTGVAQEYTNGTAIDVQGTQVVPEPATFGLMGIAGLGMFLARRKARR